MNLDPTTPPYPAGSTAPSVPNGPGTPGLDQFRSQRTLLHCLALSVLILTGTIFVYLYRQVVSIRKSTAEMARFIVQYEKSETAEVIERVRQHLDTYRKQNPAFNPIYLKYFGSNSPPETLSSRLLSTNQPLRNSTTTTNAPLKP